MNHVRKLLLALVAAVALLAWPTVARAASTTVVISQLYGGGGNTGATYNADFIELFNLGSTTIDLTGWSVQYASATGTAWTVTPISGGMLAPGQYFLIAEQGGANGAPLPTPDVTPTSAATTINLSATNAGKVAVVNNSTALVGACPTGGGIVDLIGYGTTASCFEGTAASSAPSANSDSVQRLGAGCVDTDNNKADTQTGVADARNSASANRACCSTIVCPPPSDACHVAETCDNTNSTCSPHNATDGTVCDDSDACTTNDICTGGSCAGTPITCTPLDECHVAGTCTAGTCSDPAASDGTACSIGVCMAGVCTVVMTTVTTTATGMGGSGGGALGGGGAGGTVSTANGGAAGVGGMGGSGGSASTANGGAPGVGGGTASTSIGGSGGVAPGTGGTASTATFGTGGAPTTTSNTSNGGFTSGAAEGGSTGTTGSGDSSGCGCRVDPASPGPLASLPFLAGLLLLRRRRRS